MAPKPHLKWFIPVNSSCFDSLLRVRCAMLCPSKRLLPNAVPGRRALVGLLRDGVHSRTSSVVKLYPRLTPVYYVGTQTELCLLATETASCK